MDHVLADIAFDTRGRLLKVSSWEKLLMLRTVLYGRIPVHQYKSTAAFTQGPDITLRKLIF